MTSIYYNPEKYGLGLIASYDIADSYEFDIVAVFKDSNGKYLIGYDSGCSCPIPFEYHDLNDLFTIKTLDEVANYARENWVYYESGIVENAVATLIDGLKLNV